MIHSNILLNLFTRLTEIEILELGLFSFDWFLNDVMM